MSLLSLATLEASKSNMELRLGAAIRDHHGKKFVGHNMSYITTSIHAEMDALQKCLKHHRILDLVKKLSSEQCGGGPCRERAFKGPKVHQYSQASRTRFKGSWCVQGDETLLPAF